MALHRWTKRLNLSKKKEKEIHQVGHKAFIFTFTSDLNYVFPKPLKTNET
jgi:hypothetical protein